MIGPALLAGLAEAGLLPADTQAVLLVGSRARNWQHDASDIDLIVATGQTPRGEHTFPLVRSRAGDDLVGAISEFDGRDVEIHYWSQPQMDALLAAASWQVFDESAPTGDPFSAKERQFADRVSTGQPLTGEQWWLGCRDALRGSAFGSLCIQYSLDSADGVIGKALGLARSGDGYAAVLAAKDAFDHAADALILGAGELGPLRKWRARRFQDAAARLPVDFETFWALETMQHFDPEQPGRWVDRVAAFVRTVALHTELDPRPGRYRDEGDAGDQAGAVEPAAERAPLDCYPRLLPEVRVRRVRDGLLLFGADGAVLLDEPQERLVYRADGRHTVAELAAAVESDRSAAKPAAIARELFGGLAAEGLFELAGSADSDGYL